MDHLLNLISGARRVLVLRGERDYVRPQGGFSRDAAALRGDAARVAAGLTDALRKHGKQINDRKS